MKNCVPTCLVLTFAAVSNASQVDPESNEGHIPPSPRLRGSHRDLTIEHESESSYRYTFDNDCYNEGNECPEGTFCQVAERDNWYPYDVSYINRGRCLPYAKLGGSCDVPFEGTTSFPRKADGGFFERSTLCEPSTSCTGDHIFVLPPTCVQKRDPSKGCMSTQRNGCAGRSSLGECPDDSFCFFPRDDNKATEPSATKPTINAGMTRTKLEQCAALLTSFNGPNFAFTMANGALPDDSHIEAGETKLLTKKSIAHGSRMAPNVQHILEALWPYPICSRDDSSTDCTSFPLPVPARDNDGGLIHGKCLQFTDNQQPIEVDCNSLGSSVDMSFLQPNSSSGATDYHCTWAVLHTLSFNGPAVLTSSEKRALGELILYISGQFDCKVCRNNFANIIKHFGLPQGNIREDYARWLWQAHNNANEHSYATHSKDLFQVETLSRQSSSRTVLTNPFSQTRTNEWSNPAYEHPWYMEFEDAARVWTGIHLAT